MSSGYSVDSSSGILKISGPSIENAESGDWSIREFGVGRFLLQSNELTKQMPISNDGNAWCSIDTFTDFIFGVHHRKWSGTIVVDTGFGIKRVYFLDGEIVFAGTNVMDDRLGEVLYRKGLLTIDQLMDTSVKVSREKKFGQVLLASGVFSNLQLWDALKCQVRELVRSIFMSEYVYFEMLRDNAPAPTQVVFTEGSYSFLESCHGYGCMYRDFVARLQQDTEVQVINPEYVKLEVGEGNFIADLIGMIEKSKNIEDILRTSKLLELNTLAALMLLVNRGICSISPSEDSQLHSDKLHLKKLQNKLDIYSFMLSEVRKAFQMNGVSLPK
ncbi:MAG: hypothetical protein R3B45_06020 [Bdellovibrionota bacterium]